MWMVYALLSAVFSAGTALFIKLGLRDVNAAYATAVRTSVVLVMTWIMAWIARGRGGEMHIGGSQLLFLVLSAVATGGAWLCYNQAMQLGPATRVASVDKLSIVFIAALSAAFLGESMNLTAILAIALIAGGTVLLVFA